VQARRLLARRARHTITEETPVKTSLLLATVLWTSFSPAPTNSFNAVIKGRERQSLAGTSGIAAFKLDSDAIRYEVRIADLKQVTDVVLLAGNKPIKLYGAPPSERVTLEATGILTGADLQGLSVADVRKAMESGKAQVMVFTVKFPDGSISGTVVPVPDAPAESPAPAPKVTAQKS
jgi:hypothetical protein